MASIRLCMVTCLCLAVNVIRIHGFPNGAPLTACATQTPGHKMTGTDTPIDPQATPNPYSIAITEGATTYMPGTPIKLKIEGTGDFYGVFLQALQAGTNTPVGTFEDPTTVSGSRMKLRPCPADSSPDNGVTHVNAGVQANVIQPGAVELTWNPPSSDMGDVVFTATVARNHDVFWLGAVSPTLTYSDVTTEPEPTAAPEQTTTATGPVGPSAWCLAAIVSIAIISKALGA